MSWADKLYLGTWQLSGDFRPLTWEGKLGIIDYALDHGIKRFDTAAVYGAGSVEQLLGEFTSSSMTVLTKIPALIKPRKDSAPDIRSAYPSRHLYDSLSASLARLRRDYVDIVLLHNWHEAWNENGEEVLSDLRGLVTHGLARRIGISLPDDYGTPLTNDVLKTIDVIEAPFNLQNRWVIGDIERYASTHKELILRSLFLRGNLLKQAGTVRQTIERILRDTLATGSNICIGMSEKQQIITNVEILKEILNEQ